MKTILFDAICRVGIFLICARTVVHFRPKGAYEKYLKLLVSAMVLIQLIFPMSSFFMGGGGFRVKSGIEFFTKEFEKDMEEIRSDLADTDNLLRNMTLRQVREQTAVAEQETGREKNLKEEEKLWPEEQEKRSGEVGPEEEIGPEEEVGSEDGRQEGKTDWETIEPVEIRVP